MITGEELMHDYMMHKIKGRGLFTLVIDGIKGTFILEDIDFEKRMIKVTSLSGEHPTPSGTSKYFYIDSIRIKKTSSFEKFTF